MDIEIKHEDELTEFLRPFEGNIYIVGAGKYAKLLGRFLCRSRIGWKGYIDGRKKKRGEKEPGTGKEILVYPTAFEKNDHFIVSSEIYGEEMIKQLGEAGVSDKHIWNFPYIEDIIWEISGSPAEWGNNLKKVRAFHLLME